MKKNKELFNFLLIGICALIISYLAVWAPNKFTLSLNDLTLQYIHYNKNFRSTFKISFKPLKVIAAGIDKYTLEKISYRFPFPRSIYGELVKNLDREKVNTVGFDLVFEGASSDPREDASFAQSLSSAASARVVLAFILGSGTDNQPYILPQPEFRKNSFALGLIDIQKDPDLKNRRLNAFISTENNEELRYSLGVQLAASYLNKPASRVVEAVPSFNKEILPAGLMNIEVKSFLINYVAIPRESDLVTHISFYDLYANLDSLKKQFGRDFLKDSLVLVYPEAEILHYTVITPLGKFPGGFLHINGLFDIISAKFILGSFLLNFIFLAAGLTIILLSLRYAGFFYSFLLVCGFFLASFWAAVALWLQGVAINLAQLVIFSLIFFAAGNFYKYVLALLQLEAIKNKVVLDPLRNFYTLRYFFYHYDLAARKFYPGKDLYLFLPFARRVC